MQVTRCGPSGPSSGSMYKNLPTTHLGYTV